MVVIIRILWKAKPIMRVRGISILDPRPLVLSTCRKYHREGTRTKYGRNKAVAFLNSLLDAELLSQQNDFKSKHSEV